MSNNNKKGGIIDAFPVALANYFVGNKIKHDANRIKEFKRIQSKVNALKQTPSKHNLNKVDDNFFDEFDKAKKKIDKQKNSKLPKIKSGLIKKILNKIRVGPVFLLEDQIPSNLKVETFNKGSSAKKKTKKKRPKGIGIALRGYGKAMK